MKNVLHGIKIMGTYPRTHFSGSDYFFEKVINKCTGRLIIVEFAFTYDVERASL